jgi:hypothetical protein
MDSPRAARDLLLFVHPITNTFHARLPIVPSHRQNFAISGQGRPNIRDISYPLRIRNFQCMTSVGPSHFCIDRSVFPRAGCSMSNRPSIVLTFPSPRVVLPDTVRVSEYLIKGSRCSNTIVRASVPRGRVGPDRATLSFQVPERLGRSIPETCPGSAIAMEINPKQASTRSMTVVYIASAKGVGKDRRLNRILGGLLKHPFAVSLLGLAMAADQTGLCVSLNTYASPTE